MPAAVEMHYRESNQDSAETVVFLHGGNVAGWMWEPQLAALADYHCLVPDLPGFGRSRDMEWRSMANAAGQVAELIRTKAHGGKAHLVGLSLGAVLGCHVAGEHPDTVRSAFLSGGPLIPPGPGIRLLMGIQLRLWDYGWFWSATGRGYGLAGEDLAVFVDTALGISKDNRGRILAEASCPFPAEILGKISAPTLYVAGEKDLKLLRDSLAVAAHHVPDARTALVPGMHHQWNIEDIGLFNRSLGAWLEGMNLSAELWPLTEAVGDSGAPRR